MKLTKIMLSLGTLTLALTAAENRYNLKVSSPTWVGATELKPGDYKIEMQGDKAVIRTGKTTTVEAPATLVNGDRKFSVTAIETGAGSKVTAIELGGTTSKIVLKSAPATQAGN